MIFSFLGLLVLIYILGVLTGLGAETKRLSRKSRRLAEQIRELNARRWR